MSVLIQLRIALFAALASLLPRGDAKSERASLRIGFIPFSCTLADISAITLTSHRWSWTDFMGRIEGTISREDKNKPRLGDYDGVISVRNPNRECDRLSITTRDRTSRFPRYLGNLASLIS